MSFKVAFSITKCRIEYYEFLCQCRQMGTETDHTPYPALILFWHSWAQSHSTHEKSQSIIQSPISICMNIDNSPLSHGTAPLLIMSKYAKKNNEKSIDRWRVLSSTVSLEWIHKKYLNSFPTCRYAYAECFLCRKRATVETWCAHAEIGWRIFLRFFPLFGAVNLSYAMTMRHVRRTLCTEWNIPASSTPIYWQIGYVSAGRRKI